jgi:hypothetical protein
MVDMAVLMEQQVLVAEVVLVEPMELPQVGLALLAQGALMAVVADQVHKLRDVLAIFMLVLLEQ